MLLDSMSFRLNKMLNILIFWTLGMSADWVNCHLKIYELLICHV